VGLVLMKYNSITIGFNFKTATMYRFLRVHFIAYYNN
jgi:hypothetical protein